MAEKEIKLKMNSLRDLAWKTYSNPLSFNDLTKTRNNVTEEFWEHIDTAIKDKEMLRIVINGLTGSSKSTVAGLIAEYMNYKLGKKMKIEYIASDQIEYSRKMMDKKINNVALVVDEIGSLQKGNYNSSTEAQLIDHFSSVFAQLYVYPLICTPTGDSFDKNTDLILTFLEKNTKEKYSVFTLTYKLRMPDGSSNVNLGYVVFDVKATIQRDWYKTYRERKFLKFDLLKKDLIGDIRTLEESKIIINAFNELKEGAKVIAHTKDSVGGTITRVMIEKDIKRIFSILGGDYISGILATLLKQVYHLGKIEKEINKLKSKKDAMENDYIKWRIKELEKGKADIEKGLKSEIEFHKRRSKMLDEYKAISEGKITKEEELTTLEVKE
jgi:hypothetical protein